jgi:hypothetical protein
MTNLRNSIKDYMAGVADKQIETGLIVSKIGTKYVTILNVYSGTTEIEKIELAYFARKYKIN